MKEVLQFLQEAKVFHLATTEGNQPRVRPFGLAIEDAGRIYFCTSNQKDVYKQMQANPQVEMCGMHPDGRWIRLSGKAVFDGSMSAKNKAIEGVRDIYQTADNPIFEVFYLADAKATVYSFTADPVELPL